MFPFQVSRQLVRMSASYLLSVRLKSAQTPVTETRAPRSIRPHSPADRAAPGPQDAIYTGPIGFSREGCDSSERSGYPPLMIGSYISVLSYSALLGSDWDAGRLYAAAVSCPIDNIPAIPLLYIYNLAQKRNNPSLPLATQTLFRLLALPP